MEQEYHYQKNNDFRYGNGRDSCHEIQLFSFVAYREHRQIHTNPAAEKGSQKQIFFGDSSGISDGSFFVIHHHAYCNDIDDQDINSV